MVPSATLIAQTKLNQLLGPQTQRDNELLIRDLTTYIQAMELRLAEYDTIFANIESRLVAGGL